MNGFVNSENFYARKKQTIQKEFQMHLFLSPLKQTRSSQQILMQKKVKEKIITYIHTLEIRHECKW